MGALLVVAASKSESNLPARGSLITIDRSMSWHLRTGVSAVCYQPEYSVALRRIIDNILCRCDELLFLASSLLEAS